ncbi:MAG: 2-C-methyl-D-erythritol 4-phosphate cytidylyltransferase [Paracoccaceae bacterium]
MQVMVQAYSAPAGHIAPQGDVSLLLLSGGIGARSGHNIPKQFYELHGHPLIAYSIIAAQKVERIGEIVVNCPDGFFDRTRQIMASYCTAKPYRIVHAGSTRQQSSHILADAAEFSTVILHEAARPFVDAAMYRNMIDAPALNASYVYQISFSMCAVSPADSTIAAGVPRDKVFDIQLPQKFKRKTLLHAHECARAAGKSFTEDAVMVSEMTGDPVTTMTGSSRNIKVTNPVDFEMAQQIMNAKAIE